MPLIWQLCYSLFIAEVTWANKYRFPSVCPVSLSYTHDTKCSVWNSQMLCCYKKNLPIEHFSVPDLGSSVSALRLYLSLQLSAALWALTLTPSSQPYLDTAAALACHFNQTPFIHFLTLTQIPLIFLYILKYQIVYSSVPQLVWTAKLSELNRHFRLATETHSPINSNTRLQFFRERLTYRLFLLIAGRGG